MESNLEAYNRYKEYKRIKGINDRYLEYVAIKTASNGSVRASVNRYDNILKWVTYVDDYRFNSAKDKIVYKNGYGYPASYFS